MRLLIPIMAYIDYKTHSVSSLANMCILLFGLFNDVNVLSKIKGLIMIPICLLIIKHFEKNMIGDGDIEFIAALGFYYGHLKISLIFFIGLMFVKIYLLIRPKEKIALLPFLYLALIICDFYTI